MFILCFLIVFSIRYDASKEKQMTSELGITLTASLILYVLVKIFEIAVNYS